MEARRDVFQAIADPIRRQIIHLVVDKPQSLNAIAENFNVTRQAISLHVRILEECGLVVIRQQGRERHCEAKLGKLSEIAVWVEQYKKFYEDKLDNLQSYLYQLQKVRKNAKRKK